jgi:hypothetical protein
MRCLKGETMRFRWPEGTEFRRLVLDVEQDFCGSCGRPLHVCDHRLHRIYTLQHPLELCCRLAHCSDPACPTRPRTLSPPGELSLTLPGWLIGWDVFCFIGHRRFARHWSVPQIRDELSDSYHIRLSVDAISAYLRRYQAMLTARQQDPSLLRLAYQHVDDLWLSIDGLQPEKGHETLYAVRELNAGRIWFAQALLSSNQDEVCRLLTRARDFAQTLGKPVRVWVSDKQDAFVKGLALEFPGVPHRYCSNHFLRDLAKPTLETDSHAKVQMRTKVRGLREIERQVLRSRQDDAKAVTPQADTPDGAGTARGEMEAKPRPRARAAAGSASAEVVGTSAAGRSAVGDSADAVVLDYCCVVRGILNDDQGGPLHPPGLRMAQALAEVRGSLGRVLALNKPGPAHRQLARLAGYIDQGLAAVRGQQQQVEEQVAAIAAVAGTLAVQGVTLRQQRARYQSLLRQYQGRGGEFYGRLAKVMKGWRAGLFLTVRGRRSREAPWDNLDLERWFRLPKGHERRIHGHRHAGVRIVQEGPTLLLALDAHVAHPEPFCAQDLLPYRHAQEPSDQLQAVHRRKVMRKARSQKSEHPC